MSRPRRPAFRRRTPLCRDPRPPHIDMQQRQIGRLSRFVALRKKHNAHMYLRPPTIAFLRLGAQKALNYRLPAAWYGRPVDKTLLCTRHTRSRPRFRKSYV